MPRLNENNNYVPDYGSCDTKAAVEKEFNDWGNYMSIAWYQADHPGTSENVAKAEIQKLLDQGKYKNFYSYTDEDGDRWYYTGGKSDRKKELKNQHSSMNTAKKSLTASAATSAITQAKEHSYTITGKKVYEKDQRAEFTEISEGIKNGTLTGEEKEAAIKQLNEKYGTDLSSDASWKDVKKEGNKSTGGIGNEAKKAWSSVSTGVKTATNEIGSWFTHEVDPETGKKKPSKIESAVSDLNRKTFGSASTIWDNSENETIKKFSDQGISGDIMWGVLTGKYNTDDKCRKDLKNLAEDIKNGKLSDEERRARIRAINEKYNLNIDENADSADLTAVIDSQDSYSYKKKVKDIAGRIVYDKVNDNLNTQLEQRFGKTLSKFGINFSFKNRDTIADLKAIVRGQKMIFLDKDKALARMKEQLELKIGKLIDEKVFQALDGKVNEVNKKLDDAAAKLNQKLVDNSVYRQVDAWDKQLTTWTSNPDTLKLEIANKLDSAISNPVNGIANTLDKMDPFAKLGLGSLGLGKMFTSITGEYTKGFAEKINNVVQPLLKKALGITTKIKAAVKKLQQKITDLKNKAKALIEKWKNTVKDAVKKVTKAIVNEITKYVKVNIMGSIGSSFKI